MPAAVAYALDAPNGSFRRTTIARREPGPHEVLLDVKYAGICHSDIHTARGEWGRPRYPLVPGHEIAGVVGEIGAEVTKFAVGDRVGVGCFVDSCRECEQCRDGMEQFCDGPGGTIWTYNSLGRDGLATAGGYSTCITVEEDYVVGIPDGLDLAEAAPLMCAGITLYSPLKHWGAGPGKRVAVVGMGGLGHLGVKIASAMGAEVAVLSRTLSKEADGRRFGAAEYHATSDPATFRGLRRSFDLMISTVSGDVDLNRLLGCLKVDGVLVDVGLPEHPQSIRLGLLTAGRRSLAGSSIGGIAETQEMLGFCAAHRLGAEVEVIGGEDITAAYDRVVGSQVRYRYVIDTATFGAAR